jgi:ribosomal protein S19E (S16A)
MVDESRSAAEPASTLPETKEVKPDAPDRQFERKASGVAVLKFINEVDVVRIETLMKRFGYTYRGAYGMVQRLKKQGEIVRYMKAGEYCVTDAGLRRIKDDQKGG